MSLPTLEHAHLHAYYEEEFRLMRVKYEGEMPPDTPALFFQWLYAFDAAIGIEQVRGAIFDFRLVQTFHTYNLGASVREAKSANRKIEMGHLPIAYIVTTLYQEEMARVYINLTPQPERRVIVRSEYEALQFIEDWNSKHSG